MNGVTSSLRRRRGIEGPRGDPYSFEEYVFERILLDGSSRRSILHLGPGDWCEIAGGRRLYEDTAPAIASFEAEVGLSMNQIERACDRLEAPPRRCRSCGGRKFESGPGYVGEKIVCCRTCGATVWSQPVTEAMIK